MCHQTVSLIARHLESTGLPTVCLGSAYDIFTVAKPPRAVFVDYPLGHSAGKPFSPEDQYSVVKSALHAFESIGRSGHIETLAKAWDPDSSWKAAAVDSSQGDVRQPRDTTPRYQYEADRLAAESRAMD